MVRPVWASIQISLGYAESDFGIYTTVWVTCGWSRFVELFVDQPILRTVVFLKIRAVGVLIMLVRSSEGRYMPLTTAIS